MEQNVSKSPQACPRECFRIPTSVAEDKQRGCFPEVRVLGEYPAIQEKTPKSQEENMQRATAHISFASGNKGQYRENAALWWHQERQKINVK